MYGGEGGGQGLELPDRPAHDTDSTDGGVSPHQLSRQYVAQLGERVGAEPGGEHAEAGQEKRKIEIETKIKTYIDQDVDQDVDQDRY